MTGAVVVLATASDPMSAERLATLLVEARLAACVNVIPGVVSIYRWKDAVVRDGERLLVIKTTADRFEELKKRLVAEHGYDVPEVLAVPVADGHAPYLAWLEGAVSPVDTPDTTPRAR